MGREKVLRAWLEGRRGKVCVCTRVCVSACLWGVWCARASVISSERDARAGFCRVRTASYGRARWPVSMTFAFVSAGRVYRTD